MTLPGGLLATNVRGWYAARLDPGALDGIAVATLPDVSGNGYDITQSNPLRQYVHRANHYGALSTWEAGVDGVSGYQKAWPSISEPFTVFRVVEVTGPMNTDYCFSSGYSKPQKHMVGIYNGNHKYVMEQEGTGQHIYGGSPASNQLVVLRAEYATVDKLFVNGVQVISGNAGNDASVGCTIGCRENFQRGLEGFDSEYGFALGIGLTDVEDDLRSIYGV